MITPIKTQSQAEEKALTLNLSVQQPMWRERFDVGNVFDQFCSLVSYLEQPQKRPSRPWLRNAMWRNKSTPMRVLFMRRINITIWPHNVSAHLLHTQNVQMFLRHITIYKSKWRLFSRNCQTLWSMSVMNVMDYTCGRAPVWTNVNLQKTHWF